MKKPIKFHTAAENIELAPALSKIRQIINETAQITNMLHNNLPSLSQICHCGAIDHDEEIIVLFVANNSAFYKVNQLIPQIEDILYAHQIRYNKLMIKVRPETAVSSKRKKPHLLTPEQRDGWRKLAAQIGREDLIKNDNEIILNTSHNQDDDFIIKL